MIAEPLVKDNKFLKNENNKIESTSKINQIDLVKNKIERKPEKTERILRNLNTKIRKKECRVEKKIDSMSLKIFSTIIFIIGITVGSIVYRILLEDPIIQEEIIDNFSVLSINEIVREELMKESLLKNFKILVIFWIAGISIVGVPVILILCFYKGFSTAFVIGSFLIKYGFVEGNLYIFKYLFPYYVFAILGIIILTSSSLKLSLNVLKEKNDIRYEIIRHSIVTIMASLLLLISTLIEVNIFTN